MKFLTFTQEAVHEAPSAPCTLRGKLSYRGDVILANRAIPSDESLVDLLPALPLSQLWSHAGWTLL